MSSESIKTGQEPFRNCPSHWISLHFSFHFELKSGYRERHFRGGIGARDKYQDTGLSGQVSGKTLRWGEVLRGACQEFCSRRQPVNADAGESADG